MTARGCWPCILVRSGEVSIKHGIAITLKQKDVALCRIPGKSEDGLNSEALLSKFGVGSPDGSLVTSPPIH